MSSSQISLIWLAEKKFYYLLEKKNKNEKQVDLVLPFAFHSCLFQSDKAWKEDTNKNYKVGMIF